MSDFIGWLSKYLGIEKNPTATIIVSLSVFSLGIIINETIKAVARYKERNIIREIVRRNYLIFRSYLIDQATSLRLFESFVSTEGSPDFNIYVQPCSALDSFKDISYNSCFKSFFVGVENIRGRTKRIEAFDNLYNSISVIRIEQEKMFPIVARFQNEASPIFDRLNNSLKDAFEATTDVYASIYQKTPNQELASWLKERDRLHKIYISKGKINDINEIKSYLLSILVFEGRNGKPIAQVLNAKEFWLYHGKIHNAVKDIDNLNALVNNTKAYCITISEKFAATAQQLVIDYEPLFGKKLRDRR